MIFFLQNTNNLRIEATILLIVPEKDSLATNRKAHLTFTIYLIIIIDDMTCFLLKEMLRLDTFILIW